MERWRVTSIARIEQPADVAIVGDRFVVASASEVVILDRSGQVLARRSVPNLLGIANHNGSFAFLSLDRGVVRTDVDFSSEVVLCTQEVLRSMGIFVSDLLSPLPSLVSDGRRLLLLDRRRRVLFEKIDAVPVIAHDLPDMTSLPHALLVDVCVNRSCVHAALNGPSDVVRLRKNDAESLGSGFFRNPRRVITDGTDVYVLDAGRIVAVRGGIAEAIAGGLEAEEAVDGPGDVARFAFGGGPGAALDTDGSLIVGDTGNDRICRVEKLP